MNNITVFTVFSQYCTVFTQYFLLYFQKFPPSPPPKERESDKEWDQEVQKGNVGALLIVLKVSFFLVSEIAPFRSVI